MQYYFFNGVKLISFNMEHSEILEVEKKNQGTEQLYTTIGVTGKLDMYIYVLKYLGYLWKGNKNSCPWGGRNGAGG